jgi:hypothetical protein
VEVTIPRGCSAGYLRRRHGKRAASSASRTDWQIVKEVLAGRGNGFVRQYHVHKVNPAVKDRVNCVNAVLRNTVGEDRLRVDPRCQQLILDFERVHWKTDASGNPLGDRRGHTSAMRWAI